MPFRALWQLLLCLFADATVFYASPDGDNLALATRAQPTSLAQCVAALKQSGDECRLLGGTYSGQPTAVLSASASGTASKPIIIAAAPGHEVILDGTSAVTGEWAKAPSSTTRCPALYVLDHKPSSPSSAPDAGVYQLFVDGEMQTPARWPNALWSDRSVFDWTNWATFDGTKPWDPSKYKPGVPMTFYDAGSTGNAARARARLADEKGLNATGAMFVGNIAHMDTFVGTVTAHTPGSAQFTVAMGVDKMGNTKSDNSIYFLEGLPAFADVPTEFAYDPKTRKLFLCTAGAGGGGTVASPSRGPGPPRAGAARHKTQTYALNVSGGSAHVTVANLTLFATTVNAAAAAPTLALESVAFRFPSFSRRMLGSPKAAAPTVLTSSTSAADATTTTTTTTTAPATAATTAATSATATTLPALDVFNCTWFGADGPVITSSGPGTRWVNNLFEANDWSGADVDNHRGMGSHVLSSADSRGDVFVRNSLRGNGPSVGYACGAGANVSLNRCDAEADIANDGACIQVRSSSATNTTVRRNWAIDSAKGIRLDSGSNSQFVPAEVGNVVAENVALWSNGFELKNDYNRYTSNLALWGPRGKVHGAYQYASLRVDAGRFAGENAHSVVAGNIAAGWEPYPDLPGIKRYTPPGTTSTSSSTSGGSSTSNTGVLEGNILDAKAGNQLRDPAGHDFRTIEGTAAAKAGAGPYPYGGGSSSSSSGSDSSGSGSGSSSSGIACERYWIPGRRSWRPSSPVPPDGYTGADPTLDLMFLPALAPLTAPLGVLAAGLPAPLSSRRGRGRDARATGARHRVLLGPAPGALVPVGGGAAVPLPGGCNVQSLQSPSLSAGGRGRKGGSGSSTTTTTTSSSSSTNGSNWTVSSPIPYPLPLNSTWYWRVDMLPDDEGDEGSAGDGGVVQGPVWSFRVRNSAGPFHPPSPAPVPPTTPTPTPPTPPPEPSKKPTPKPVRPTPPAPKPPVPPPSAACTACESKYCPGQQGKGAACEQCVETNKRAFKAAGCWADSRHAFLDAWCDGKAL